MNMMHVVSRLAFFDFRSIKTYHVTVVTLKDKSGVGIIVDYSKDYTVVNGV